MSGAYLRTRIVDISFAIYVPSWLVSVRLGRVYLVYNGLNGGRPAVAPPAKRSRRSCRRPPPVESVLTGGPDRPRPGSMVMIIKKLYHKGATISITTLETVWGLPGHFHLGSVYLAGPGSSVVNSIWLNSPLIHRFWYYFWNKFMRLEVKTGGVRSNSINTRNTGYG